MSFLLGYVVGRSAEQLRQQVKQSPPGEFDVVPFVVMGGLASAAFFFLAFAGWMGWL